MNFKFNVSGLNIQLPKELLSNEVAITIGDFSYEVEEMDLQAASQAMSSFLSLYASLLNGEVPTNVEPTPAAQPANDTLDYYIESNKQLSDELEELLIAYQEQSIEFGNLYEEYQALNTTTNDLAEQLKTLRLAMKA